MKNKGKIVAFMFITDDNADAFNNTVKETIEKYQDANLYVEVQFTINDKQYGAMVIARA
jgi:hypothetical protein